jgi:hypothetical protein
MKYHYTRDTRSIEITPEKALWCSVFVTFFEDMNYYIELKTKVLESDKKEFDLKNVGLDTTGVVKKDKYLALLDMRMRRLIYSAKHPYTRQTFDIIDLNHSAFYKRLIWQYKHNAKIKLTALNFIY